MTDLYPLNSQNVQTVGPTSINNAGQVASGVLVDGVYVPAVLDSKTGDLTSSVPLVVLLLSVSTESQRQSIMRGMLQVIPTSTALIDTRSCKATVR
jgi:hypothetical protein